MATAAQHGPGHTGVRALPALLPPAAGLVLALAWLWLHPFFPPEPTADLYENLSVARHLVRGEGFLCDITYPLSFAFPFAARLPQPLIQRPPGPALLLTLPVVAARGDPQGAVRAAQWLHVVLLALVAAAGARAALRACRPEAIVPFLALLLGNPLLAMTVGGAQSETPAALVLALLWWRLRSPDAGSDPPCSPVRRGAADGALAAVVALLRADLCWVPWLWLVCRGSPRPRRAMLAALAVWLLLLAPWGIRNTRVTGSPFFNLQAYGEVVKETPAWPGLSVYSQLEPQPAWRALRDDPGAQLRKTAAGLRYFAARSGRWLPWPLWLVGAWLLLRRNAGRPPEPRRRARPLAVLGVTLAGLVVQYAAVSHTLRYLAVLLPVLGWEIWIGAATWWRQTSPDRRPAARVAVFALAAVLLQLTAPSRMPGWERTRREAIAADSVTEEARARLATQPAGPIFTDNAALLWRSGRAGVALPDAAVLATLRARVPALARAPVVLALREPDTPAR